MAQKGLYKIHPKFRIIALAEPPGISGKFKLRIEITFTYLFRIPYILLYMRFSREIFYSLAFTRDSFHVSLSLSATNERR